jgi:hypothetical protein
VRGERVTATPPTLPKEAHRLFFSYPRWFFIYFYARFFYRLELERQYQQETERIEQKK